VPLTNSTYNALMRVYEEKRAKSRDLANLHYERACHKVPELASIDASVSSASLDQAKKLLEGNDTALASLKEESGLFLTDAPNPFRRRIPGRLSGTAFERPDCQNTANSAQKNAFLF